MVSDIEERYTKIAQIEWQEKFVVRTMRNLHSTVRILHAVYTCSGLVRSLFLSFARVGSFFLSRSRSHRSRAVHALGIERMYFFSLSLIMLRRDVFEISRIINTRNLSTRQLQSRYTRITMNYKNANNTNKYVLDSAHPQNAIMTGSRRDNTSR